MIKRLSLFTAKPSFRIVHCSLLIAIAACGGENPADPAATLDAAVRQTVAAQQTAGATPSPSPAPTNTPEPSPTEAPPISVTLQFPTDTPSPTSNSQLPTSNPTSTPMSVVTAGPLTRPNGAPVHVARLPVAPTIDGDPSEWGVLANTVDQVVFKPTNWSGPSDNGATFALGWDAANLYLAASVVDDHHQQTQRNEFIYKGDSIEILLDANLGGDYTDFNLSDDDFQLGLSPGNLATGDPAPQAWLWFPASKSGVPSGITVAAKRSGEGFTMEAAIPWAVFGVAPEGDVRYGFILSVSDNDNGNAADQESLISSASTRKLANPTTWGTLILDP